MLLHDQERIMLNEYFGKSRLIGTYFLKTIMVWAIEENPVEYWKEDNIGQAVLGLLDDLYQTVVTKNLPHYFIPQIKHGSYVNITATLDVNVKFCSQWLIMWVYISN